ncbi:MAG TPA: amidohydrolase [Planctomycetota bacterium]|nr:amidohydrolase [Planctomycetota bacterium]
MIVAIVAGAFTSLSLPQEPEPRVAPALIVRGAEVYTGTEKPWSGAFEARWGHIANPGSVLAEHHRAQVVELERGFLVPGLQDAHGHLLGLGTSLAEVDLVGTRSFDEVIERTAAAAQKLPKGQWVLGRGWDQNDWQEKAMPHHAELSVAVPDHPVWLVRIDGHAGLLNLRGLMLSGVRAGTEAPSGGEIQFDDNGEPTGVLVDAAMKAVPEPSLTPEQIRERLLAAQAECLRHGLTCVHDAGVSKTVLEEMRLLHAAGQWHLRTYVMLAQGERELIQKGPWQTKDGLIVVRAVKGYADGALGSRGASLLEPYTDRPGTRGLVGMPRGACLELAQRCADAGMQLCMHAIGDAANRTVLDAYAGVKVDGGLAARRFRVEHAQVVAEADFARFRDLGVVPSMQPTHLTSDMPWAESRLGPERVLRAYAWRSFHALGVVVPFGSDFPVESVDPRKGLYAAVTTRGEHDGPEQGYRPDQKLSRQDAIRGFTAHAASAMFAEKDLGTIEVGKLADCTVFDKNLLTCSDAELLTAKVWLTVVNGKVVYDGRGK